MPGALRASVVLAIIAVLLSAALTLPWLGEGRLVAEEPKRVVIAQTMLSDGNWLIPSLYGEPYVAKPPLTNWQIAAWTRLLGPGEFSARFGSWVMLVVLAVGMMWLLRDLISLPGRMVLIAALLTQRELWAKAQLAEIDMQFAALVALALWAWFARYERGLRGWSAWWPTVVLSTLACLSKGPLGPLFIVLGIGSYLLWRRESLRATGWFALSQIVVAGLWVGGLLLAVGTAPFEAMLAHEAMNRAAHTEVMGQVVSALKLVVGWPLSVFPWILFALPLLSGRVRGQLGPSGRRMAAFILIGSAVNLLPYLPINANPRYLLPLTPSLLVLCVLGLQALARGAVPRYARGVQWFITGLTAAALIAWPIVTVGMGRPHLMSVPTVISLSLVAVAALIAAAIRGRGRPWTVAAVGCVLFLTAFHLIEVDVVRKRTIDRDEWRRNPVAILEATAELGARPGSVAVVGRPPEDLYYYDREGLLRLPTAGLTEASHVLVMDSQRDRLPPGIGPTPVAEWPFKSEDSVLLYEQ